MSDMNSWMALRSAMQGDGRARRPVRPDTVRRVVDFARPQRRTIASFLLLATEQAAGSVGRQVTALALPLLAITELNAGPLGAATLMALTYVPGIVLSPYIGVAVDGPFKPEHYRY